MTEHPIILPTGEVANVTATGITSLKLTVKKSSVNHRLIGIILKFGANFTYATGGGTSVSTAIRDVQIVNEAKQNFCNAKGQTLAAIGLKAFKQLGEMGLQYQAWLDAAIGATTVTAYGLFPIMSEFKGNTFSITVNINNAATAVSTASAASYVLTATAIEIPMRAGEKVRYRRILGEYITNQSNYEGTVAAKHVTVAADNAELTTLTAVISVGGKTFADTAVSDAEDVFDATLPSGISSGFGTAFAGQATLPPTNRATAHPLGIASFGGPTPSIVSLSFTSAPTLQVVTDIEVV